MALGAAVMPVAIAAPYVPTAALAIAATCFTTFGHGLWVANLQTLPTDMFRGPEIGTVSGFSGSGGAIGGILAQLGTGYVVMHFSYAPIFLLAGLMHPLSAVLIYWLLPDRFFAIRSDRSLPVTARKNEPGAGRKNEPGAGRKKGARGE
jgi:ACS family hexuronate transporter-like MFS transporter